MVSPIKSVYDAVAARNAFSLGESTDFLAAITLSSGTVIRGAVCKRRRALRGGAALIDSRKARAMQQFDVSNVARYGFAHRSSSGQNSARQFRALLASLFSRGRKLFPVK